MHRNIIVGVFIQIRYLILFFDLHELLTSADTNQMINLKS
jgi:hypothetical protein